MYDTIVSSSAFVSIRGRLVDINEMVSLPCLVRDLIWRAMDVRDSLVIVAISLMVGGLRGVITRVLRPLRRSYGSSRVVRYI